MSSAEFYGPPDNPTANLKLLNRFFKEQQGASKKAVLAIKGGIKIIDGKISHEMDLPLLVSAPALKTCCGKLASTRLTSIYREGFRQALTLKA